jgi:hypothetical protein
MLVIIGLLSIQNVLVTKSVNSFFFIVIHNCIMQIASLETWFARQSQFNAQKYVKFDTFKGFNISILCECIDM